MEMCFYPPFFFFFLVVVWIVSFKLRHSGCHYLLPLSELLEDYAVWKSLSTDTDSL